jgi:hypothetical protein
MKIPRLLLIAPFITLAALAADSSTPAAGPTPPAPGKIAPPVVQADPAAVEAALKAVHYDETMSKALNQQRQMIQQMLMRADIPGVSKEEIEAFQQKAMNAALAGLSIEEIHAVAARSYSETFTTEELRAIADFFNSPAGQAYGAKRPQAEQKTMATLRPRVMEGMEKVQQMTRDFAAQQQAKAQESAAKAAAAKASAPAAPATGATPAPTLPPKS